MLSLVVALALAQPAGQIRVTDEGVNLGYAGIVNCSGAGITCTKSGTTWTITVAGGSSDGGSLSYSFAWPLYYDGGTVGCLMAGSNDAGCLTAADWSTFNGKLTPDGGVYASGGGTASGANTGDQTKTCGAGSGVTTLAAGTSSTCAAFAGGTGTANGTNTGDVTLGTANGLSLAGQALSLATAVAGGANGALLGSDKTKLDATSGTNTGDQTKTCSAGQFVSTLAAGTGSVCTAPSAGAANFVEATLDFGASPGTDTATVSVTATWVTAASVIVCNVTAFATTDRNDGDEDGMIEEITLTPYARVVSTRFAVQGKPSVGKAIGKYIIHCTGA